MLCAIHRLARKRVKGHIGGEIGQGRRTNRKEKMIQPKKIHFPISNWMKTQPSMFAHSLKISFDQFLVVNMVMAEKISETYTRNDLRTII